jgi:uncharacterized protein
MAYSMYEATVPVMVRALRNLRGVLQIGEKFGGEKGIAPEVLLSTRLIPDMLPLLRQVQIATDTAKFACARLTATDPVPFTDDETTFEQLYARLDRCIEVLGTYRPEQFADAPSREVAFKTRTAELKFTGADYLASYALPNLFFHTAIAYAILRVAGAPLGKTDYLAGAGR